MRGIKKAVRTNQALQVIQKSNSGMSIVDACREVGIVRSTFYYFVTTNPDAVATFQEMQMIASFEQFALILANQIQILERVIQDGLADTTKPRQRLAIYKELVKRSEELRDRIMVNRYDNEEIKELMSGPNLVPGKSRFSASETTNVEGW